MGASLDPAAALARALAADRRRYNALFAAARAGGAAVDPAAFAGLLAGTLAPVAAAVAAAAPARVDAAVAALYPLALDLLGRRVLGGESRHPAVGDAWRALLPALAPLVAAAPDGVAAAVTNAAHALASTAGARPAPWIERMTALGPACADLAALRDAGALVAWQCGMAHLRDAALDAALRLPAALATAALGLDAGAQPRIGDAVARLREDRWLEPAAAARPDAAGRELRLVARVGAFRGFGGPFLDPPSVRASAGALYASDSEATWRLHADRFGAVFVRAGGSALPPTGPATLRVDRAGRVAFGGREGSFPELAEPTSFAAAGVTAAVTVRGSHAVALLAVA